MNVWALLAVGAMAALGLIGGLVTHAAHVNRPVRDTGQHGSIDAATRAALRSRFQPIRVPVWADLVKEPPDHVSYVDYVDHTGSVPADQVIDPLTPEELRRGQLDHGAESFAVHTDIFRTEHENQREEHARQMWNAGFDWYIDKINKQFDALLADLPTTGDDPFPPGYWPVVSAAPMSSPPLTLARLATFSPDATLRIIETANARRTSWSWSTGEYPAQRPPRKPPFYSGRHGA